MHQSNDSDQLPLAVGKKKAPKKGKTKGVKKLPDEKDKADETPFDFGGLPNRNLKKNLGCG